MSILRKVEFEQADFMWQYQLRYERDVVAQVEHTCSKGTFRLVKWAQLGQEWRCTAVLVDQLGAPS